MYVGRELGQLTFVMKRVLRARSKDIVIAVGVGKILCGRFEPAKQALIGRNALGIPLEQIGLLDRACYPQSSSRQGGYRRSCRRLYLSPRAEPLVKLSRQLPSIITLQ